MQEARESIRVVFACGGLKIGGVQRSLLELLKRLPLDRYTVTLLTDREGGELVAELPPEVEVRCLGSFPAQIPRILRSPIQVIRALSRQPRWVVPLVRYVLSLGERNRRALFEELWIQQQPFPPTVPELQGEHFDVAISFAGFQGVWNFLVADAIEATKRVCWIHGDYTRLATGTDAADDYLSRFDAFVAVSSECARIFKEHQTGSSVGIRVIHNITDPQSVRERAILPRDGGAEDLATDKAFSVVSVGRLDPGKGYFEALDAVDALVKSGFDLRWRIIGDGPDRNRLSERIRALSLGNIVVLEGPLTNPLPYVARADLFFHPSKSEGHSIAIEEARALGKPVLATKYATVRDQVVHEVDGLVVDSSVGSIADGLRRVIGDSDLRKRLARASSKRPQPPDPVLEFHKFMTELTLNQSR